jgi:hypothetical protein
VEIGDFNAREPALNLMIHQKRFWKDNVFGEQFSWNVKVK